MIPIALGPISLAIKALYDIASDLNEWLDDHIEAMKRHENPTISRTGKVLEGAKFGFGVGYIAPVTVIAVGQYLLGNTFAAIATIASAATLTNPIAMTCAAIGAIYYGWNALSDQERNDILDKISAGMEIGIELVRSIVNFVTAKAKELLSSRQLAEIKEFIRSAAAAFGKKLGDVTRAVSDKVADATLSAREVAGKVAKSASYGVGYTTTVAADTAIAAAESVARGARSASQAVAGTASVIVAQTTNGVRRVSDAVVDRTARAKEDLTGVLDINGDGQLDLKDVAHVGEQARKAFRRSPKRVRSTGE